MLSIIIPLYNMERLVQRCLDSILSLDGPDLEVIVIDDGSTDHSKEIVEEYVKKHDNITFISQENKGVSAARNLGIKVAHGEMLTFVDPDDFIDDTLSKDVITRSSGYDLTLFDYYEKTDTTEKIIEADVPDGYVISDDHIIQFQRFMFLRGNSKKGMDKSCLIDGKYYIPNMGTPWAKIYKREIVVDNNIEFPLGIHPTEDALFNMKYLEYCKSILIDKRSFYHYCINSESVMNSTKVDRYNNLRKGYDYVKKTYIDRKRLVDDVYFWLLNQLWFVYTRQTFNKERYRSRDEMKKVYYEYRKEYYIEDIIDNVNKKGLSMRKRAFLFFSRYNMTHIIYCIVYLSSAREKRGT